jgi:hypothetical protein
LDTHFGDARRTVAYLQYAIRWLTAKRCGRIPNADALRDIANEIAPRFNQMTKAGVGNVDEILAAVWNLGPLTQDATGSRFKVLGCVIVGLLIDDPVVDLDEIEPGMREWFANNATEFAKLFSSPS